MANNFFMDTIRMFFGLRTDEPPRNEFRNPIWGDDDDDGDELYDSVHQPENYEGYHQDMTRSLQEIFKIFGSLFGNVKVLLDEDQLEHFASLSDSLPEPEQFDNKSLRNYYLKSGYQNRISHEQQDSDLDGRISSQDITGLLNKNEKKDDNEKIAPFTGTSFPGRSFCQTIITSSIKKPDGTVETRRIVKNGDDVTEEITTTGPDSRGPNNPGLDVITNYNQFFKDFSSNWRNFY